MPPKPIKQSQALGLCLPSLSNKVRHWVYASRASQTKSGIEFMPTKPLTQSQASGLCLPSISSKVRYWVYASPASQAKLGIVVIPTKTSGQVLGSYLPTFQVAWFWTRLDGHTVNILICSLFQKCFHTALETVMEITNIQEAVLILLFFLSPKYRYVHNYGVDYLLLEAFLLYPVQLWQSTENF